MGLTDELIQGSFRWIDTNTELSGFTDWRPGQPDDRDNNEDCVSFWTDHAFLWNDAPCSYEYEAVCELR